MCSQVSWVKVTWAPPWAALAPAMQASIVVTPSDSPPISTPHTSVLLFDRACWRISRATSLLIRRVAGLSRFAFDITRLPLPGGRVSFPDLHPANSQFHARRCALGKYQMVAARAGRVFESCRVPSLRSRELCARFACDHRSGSVLVCNGARRPAQIVLPRHHSEDRRAFESRRGSTPGSLRRMPG